MCTPVAAAGVMGVGAVAGAAGTYQSSRAEQKGSYVQEEIANRNANLEEMRAKDALVRGQIAEGQQRTREEQLIGTQRATFASRGLSSNEGSALNILDTTRHMSDVDIGTIRDNASKEAWALRQSATNYRQNAELWKERGDNTNPRMNAFLSLMGGGGNVAANWYKYGGSGGGMAGPG